jgi:uncharacterized protein
MSITDAPVTSAPPTPRRRSWPWRRLVMVFSIIGLLFVLPWWCLAFGFAHWPVAVPIVLGVIFGAAMVMFPIMMMRGHGHRQLDWAARIGDSLIGVAWIFFTWAILGQLLRIPLALAGVDNRQASRIVAIAIAVVAVALVGWGNFEAMRVPRVKRLDITLDRLGAGLDGTRVVVLTDTHYGPINRARWSARVTEVINGLDADIVCHAGDIADGTAEKRHEQSAPLGTIRARLARVYVTGNHEYYSEAQGWLDRMDELGWECLHNRHVVVSSGGDQLVVAGIDDVTAASSGSPGHGTDLKGALTGADRDLPVLLVAHQPKQITETAANGVDLQVSGHTHGGQIWPFHYLVRTDQPVVAGLSRHGERTQMYTSRGAGFWGPPMRVFAPSEITLITLRSPAS